MWKFNLSTKKDLIFFLIFILVASILGISLIYYSRKTSEEFSFPPANLLYADIDEQTISCLDKIPAEENPLIGSYRVDRLGPYTELYYLSLLKSIKKEKINGCDFIKLEMLHPEFEIYYSLYVPENLPSPGAEKNTMPSEMSDFTGKTVNLKIRYGTDSSGKNPENVKNILGWQFIFSAP